MFFHYLKVGFRNILKYKVFSFINVFGLAAAMSVCMLIILMLADQKSHDQFNVKKDRVYRVLCDEPDFRHPYATSPFPLAAALKEGSPDIETATHLALGVGGDARAALQKSVEMRGYFADNAFFQVFSFELEKGNPATALAAPRSLVITHAMAQQLFNGEDPTGKTVEWVDRGLSVYGGGFAAAPTSWGIYTITGVIADKGYRSHLQFDVLMSAASLPLLQVDRKIDDHSKDWGTYTNGFTYVAMVPGKKAEDLDAGLGRLVARHYAGLKEFKGFKMMGQPLTRISPGVLLGNEPSIILPSVAYYFLWFLAMVILLSACLNYINLSVARALNRAKEIGVRKVAGAKRVNLIAQFMGESMITALFALAMALLLLFLLKAAFLRLWVNQYLNFDLEGNVMVYVVFVAFALLVGALAGLYPALHLSGFRPIPALKNNDGQRPGKLGMRKVLSVVQFVFSLFFIITSILIYNQFRYFLNFQYEFNSKNIVNVDLQSNDYRLAEREFSTIPGVTGVSACQYLPASTRSEGTSLRRADGEGRVNGKGSVGKDDFTSMMSLEADEHFLDNLGLKLLAGRGLPRARGPQDSVTDRDIVVNEAMVKAFGFHSPAEIIGQPFVTPWSDSPLVVIGVVQNFHMRMILGNDRIEPLVLRNRSVNFQYVNCRIATRDIRGTVAKLEDKWRRIDPTHPLKYSFYNEDLAKSSQGIFDVVSILGLIAVLAISIALLGMLGMAVYTTERRRKEVGIRKVLGANNARNALLLSREFLNILAIAICIAAPLSYLLNDMWLRKFPNRVEFGWGTVALGTLVVLLLGLITVGSQTVRASRRNPVASLRAD
jgi:putative ABC transport system permease protein